MGVLLPPSLQAHAALLRGFSARKCISENTRRNHHVPPHSNPEVAHRTALAYTSTLMYNPINRPHVGSEKPHHRVRHSADHIANFIWGNGTANAPDLGCSVRWRIGARAPSMTCEWWLFSRGVRAQRRAGTLDCIVCVCAREVAMRCAALLIHRHVQSCRAQRLSAATRHMHAMHGYICVAVSRRETRGRIAVGSLIAQRKAG